MRSFKDVVVPPCPPGYLTHQAGGVEQGQGGGLGRSSHTLILSQEVTHTSATLLGA